MDRKVILPPLPPGQKLRQLQNAVAPRKLIIHNSLEALKEYVLFCQDNIVNGDKSCCETVPYVLEYLKQWESIDKSLRNTRQWKHPFPLGSPWVMIRYRTTEIPESCFELRRFTMLAAQLKKDIMWDVSEYLRNFESFVMDNESENHITEVMCQSCNTIFPVKTDTMYWIGNYATCSVCHGMCPDPNKPAAWPTVHAGMPWMNLSSIVTDTSRDKLLMSVQEWLLEKYVIPSEIEIRFYFTQQDKDCGNYKSTLFLHIWRNQIGLSMLPIAKPDFDKLCETWDDRMETLRRAIIAAARAICPIHPDRATIDGGYVRISLN